MTTTTVVSKKDFINSPVYLPIGQTQGNFKISIPFPASYIMVMNDTAATIAVTNGDQSTQGPEAQIWTPGKYISMPLIEETQKLTVFWTSPQAIAADNNLVQFYFSNVTIPLQGGSYGAAAESQDVNVLNTVTVQFGPTPSVDISAMPVIEGTDGTTNHPVKTDTNGNLNTNVLSLPALPAGANNIGHIDIDLLPELPAGSNKIGQVDLSNTANLKQAITAGPVSTSQIAVGTSAIALVNGVVNGSRIKIRNSDATNSIFIGTNAVTTTTGFEIAAKEYIDLEIIPGSTITLYGIAASGTPIASVLTLN